MGRRAIALMLFATLVSGAVGPAPAAEGGTRAPVPLLFGVLNQQSTVQTAERWNPILQYLSRKTGITLVLRMGGNSDQTDAMMGREEFDLVFTNHNFQSEYDGLYRVLVRWAGPPVKGLILVRADSPIHSLADLDGRNVAFPSAEAFLGYAVTRRGLSAAGVKVVERFAGNQHSVLIQLKARQVEGASVNSRFYEDFVAREGAVLRPVFVSEAFPEMPVVVHGRVPRGQAEALAKAMLGMRRDPEAASVLREARFDGFEAASEADYDGMRRIYREIGQ